MVRFLLCNVKKEVARLLFLAVLSIMASIIAVFSPYFNGIYIDFLIGNPSINNIVLFALFIIIVGLLGIFISYIFSILNSKLKNTLTFDLESNMITHLQKVSFLFIKQYDYNYLNRRIYDDTSSLMSFFLDNYISVICQGIYLLILLIMLLNINTTIFFVCLFFIPTYIITYYFIRKTFYVKSIELKEESSVFYGKLSEQLQLVKEIKAQGSIDKNQSKLKLGYTNYLRTFLNYTKLSTAFSSIDSFLALLFQSIILIIGGIAIVNGTLTIGMYIVINTYYTMIISCIKYYFQFGKEIQQAKASYKRIIELYNIHEEINGSIKLRQINEINVNNISFTYKSDEMLIQNFSANFKKGKIYAITGNNGSGKSTLLNIIVGIINENVSGNINLDKNSLYEINLYKLRDDKISFVFQNYRYPNCTVKELISDYFKDIDLLSDINNLNLSNLMFNDLFNLFDFMNHQVNSLSDGQRQKVSILLAALKKPEILILDEPTSNLDKQSVRDLMLYLFSTKNSHITIISTHDSTLFDICDGVIRLDSNDI
ncbi:MAG: ATP-binding cassette domain-containing protein [Lachnotalea sp.]